MSYRQDFSIYWKEEVLCQLKIRGAIEKFKNQPRPLWRPKYVNFSQHFWNLSCKTVPLKKDTFKSFFRYKKVCKVTASILGVGELTQYPECGAPRRACRWGSTCTCWAGQVGSEQFWTRQKKYCREDTVNQNRQEKVNTDWLILEGKSCSKKL